ncbi:MAG: hypothetical protein ABI386_03480 [Rhodanobacter sp.]
MMGWLKTILAESWGLFVEDGRYALSIVAWLALSWLLLPPLHLGGRWSALILFVGLLAILLESVWHRARR